MTHSALVLCADGTEEIECVVIVDVLRRANIRVVLASASASRRVQCSRGVVLEADVLLDEVDAVTEFDAIVLPGGMGGAKAFASSARVHQLLAQYYSSSSKIVAAVCAGPIAFKPSGIAQNKNITSHPSVKQQLMVEGDSPWFASYSEERVVVDGRLVTSRGPGTCFEFALKIVELLSGAQVVDEVAKPMMLHPAIHSE
ncbi:Protein deglycase DJ-1zDJ-1 [Chytriomyces hyalinus]|nr:Protein deglycase DJ-1zDJ-1 [Chytriomyces hyalinus]